MTHQRACMYCGDHIFECMGYVLPRDILSWWDKTLPPDQSPRELCPKEECNNKWKQALYDETGDDSFLTWL